MRRLCERVGSHILTRILMEPLAPLAPLLIGLAIGFTFGWAFSGARSALQAPENAHLLGGLIDKETVEVAEKED